MPRITDPALVAARASGATRYLSATRCPQGHLGQRYVKGGACCLCGDLKRAAKGIKPRVKNPTPKKPRLERSAEKHAERVAMAERRFNRPAFARAEVEYRISAEGRQRSDRLDALIRGITASRSPDGHARKTPRNS